MTGILPVSIAAKDLGNAKQDYGRQKEQIDIGLDLAVATQQGNVADGLLLERRLRAAFTEQRHRAARLDLKPLDALKKIE